MAPACTITTLCTRLVWLCVSVILPSVSIHLNTAADGISTSKCSTVASIYDIKMAESVECTCKLMHDNITDKLHNGCKSQLYFISLQHVLCLHAHLQGEMWDTQTYVHVTRSTDKIYTDVRVTTVHSKTSRTLLMLQCTTYTMSGTAAHIMYHLHTCVGVFIKMEKWQIARKARPRNCNPPRNLEKKLK